LQLIIELLIQYYIAWFVVITLITLIWIILRYLFHTRSTYKFNIQKIWSILSLYLIFFIIYLHRKFYITSSILQSETFTLYIVDSTLATSQRERCHKSDLTNRTNTKATWKCGFALQCNFLCMYFASRERKRVVRQKLVIH